jgi:hypothetical protein
MLPEGFIGGNASRSTCRSHHSFARPATTSEWRGLVDRQAPLGFPEASNYGMLYISTRPLPVEFTPRTIAV